jgi:hypothetical protein
MTAVLGDPTTVEPDSTCDHCGLTDGHPKIFLMTGGVWHHECAPAKVKADIIGGSHNQHPLLFSKTVEANQNGKRGEDLRAFIKEQSMKDFGDAQMLYAQTFANDLLDATLNNGSTGTFTLGSTTYTLPFKIKWLSTVSTASTAGTEWTGGSYAALSLAGIAATAAASQAKASTSALSQTNSPALTWADNEVVDSTGTPKRVNFKGTPSLAISVSSGSTATIPTGSLTDSLT